MSQNEQYDPKVLRKLQLAELEVFKDFIKICDENGLSYFLFAGCAIGVERHKGFIPWDDDIDIGMLRDDYEKVLKIYREKYTDKYVVLDIDSQETFPFYNAEIARIGTKNIPYVFKDAKVPILLEQVKNIKRIQETCAFHAWMEEKSCKCNVYSNEQITYMDTSLKKIHQQTLYEERT